MTARWGFGRTEIIAFVAVLLVLVGILIYGTGAVQKKTRDLDREQMMKMVALSLESYKAAKGHYPITGDAIPGGSIVSDSGSFNSMMTALALGKYFDIKEFSDPGFGKVFEGFNGANSFDLGPKFDEVSKKCDGKEVVAVGNSLESVSYAYTSDSGETYTMCLAREDGTVVKFVSPKDI